MTHSRARLVVTACRALCAGLAATLLVVATQPAVGHAAALAAVDTDAPTVSRLKVSPAQFRVAGTTPTFSFGLSEPASVRLTIARERSGVLGRLRHGGKVHCLSGPARRGRTRCTRHETIGALNLDAGAGETELPFDGHLDGRALAPGLYRVTLRARDASLNRSRPYGLSFRVLRPR
jgi:hypothetical protein